MNDNKDIVNEQINLMFMRRLGFLKSLLNEDSRFVNIETKRPVEKWMRDDTDKDKDEKILNEWKEWEDRQKEVRNRVAPTIESKWTDKFESKKNLVTH